MGAVQEVWGRAVAAQMKRMKYDGLAAESWRSEKAHRLAAESLDRQPQGDAVQGSTFRAEIALEHLVEQLCWQQLL